MKMMSVILFLSLMVSTPTQGFNNQLLTQEDIEFLEKNHAQGAALSSGNENSLQWESYNQWQCFDVMSVSYDCADYDSGTLVPSLKIENLDEIFYFDTHVEENLECEQTLTQWRDLVQNGEEICIFAALIPGVNMGLNKGKLQSLWYISRIKGINGYWHL